jgi:peptidyl-tRNA hydrolase
MKSTHKQIILMRSDIKMGPGKMISQGAHASLAALLSISKWESDSVNIPLDANTKEWLITDFTKIVLKCDSEDDICHLVDLAKSKGLPAAIIIDNGQTVFNGVHTLTCGAIGPAPRAAIDDLMQSRLKLLR